MSGSRETQRAAQRARQLQMEEEAEWDYGPAWGHAGVGEPAESAGWGGALGSTFGLLAGGAVRSAGAFGHLADWAAGDTMVGRAGLAFGRGADRAADWIEENTLHPGVRTALNRSMFDAGSVGEFVSSLGAQAISSVPSALFAWIPGVMAARIATAGARAAAAAGGAAVPANAGRAAAAFGAGGGIGGLIAGTTAEAIRTELEAATPEQMQGTPEYDRRRADGMTHEQAIQELIRESRGFNPLIAGAVGAAASAFFVGPQAAALATGGTRGAVRGALRSGSAEARAEFVQEGAQDVATQDAVNRLLRRDYDVGRTLRAGAEGAILGAGAGGVIGGVGGAISGREQARLQAQQEAREEQLRRANIDAAAAEAARVAARTSAFGPAGSPPPMIPPQLVTASGGVTQPQVATPAGSVSPAMAPSAAGAAGMFPPGMQPEAPPMVPPGAQFGVEGGAQPGAFGALESGPDVAPLPSQAPRPEGTAYQPAPRRAAVPPLPSTAEIAGIRQAATPEQTQLEAATPEQMQGTPEYDRRRADGMTHEQAIQELIRESRRTDIGRTVRGARAQGEARPLPPKARLLPEIGADRIGVARTAGPVALNALADARSEVEKVRGMLKRIQDAGTPVDPDTRALISTLGTAIAALNSATAKSKRGDPPTIRTRAEALAGVARDVFKRLPEPTGPAPIGPAPAGPAPGPARRRTRSKRPAETASDAKPASGAEPAPAAKPAARPRARTTAQSKRPGAKDSESDSERTEAPGAKSGPSKTPETPEKAPDAGSEERTGKRDKKRVVVRRGDEDPRSPEASETPEASDAAPETPPARRESVPHPMVWDPENGVVDITVPDNTPLSVTHAQKLAQDKATQDRVMAAASERLGDPPPGLRHKDLVPSETVRGYIQTAALFSDTSARAEDIAAQAVVMHVNTLLGERAAAAERVAAAAAASVAPKGRSVDSASVTQSIALGLQANAPTAWTILENALRKAGEGATVRANSTLRDTKSAFRKLVKANPEVMPGVRLNDVLGVPEGQTDLGSNPEAYTVAAGRVANHRRTTIESNRDKVTTAADAYIERINKVLDGPKRSFAEISKLAQEFVAAIHAALGISNTESVAWVSSERGGVDLGTKQREAVYAKLGDINAYNATPLTPAGAYYWMMDILAKPSKGRGQDYYQRAALAITGIKAARIDPVPAGQDPIMHVAQKIADAVHEYKAEQNAAIQASTQEWGSDRDSADVLDRALQDSDETVVDSGLPSESLGRGSRMAQPVSYDTPKGPAYGDAGDAYSANRLVAILREYISVLSPDLLRLQGHRSFPASQGLASIDAALGGNRRKDFQGVMDRAVARAVRETAGDTPVVVVPDAVWRRAQEIAGETDTRAVFVANSATDMALTGQVGVIYISAEWVAQQNTADRREQGARLLAHEMVHAATYVRLETDANLRRRVDKLREAILDRIDGTPYAENLDVTYALQDAHEFLTGAMTTVAVRDMLARMELTPADRAMLGIKPRTPTRTFWDALMKALADALRIFSPQGRANFTALSEAVGLAQEAMATPADSAAIVRVALHERTQNSVFYDPSGDPRSLDAPNNPHVLPGRIAQTLESFTNSIANNADKSITAMMADKTVRGTQNAIAALRKGVLGLRTVSQLEMASRKLFKPTERLRLLYGDALEERNGATLAKDAILEKGIIARDEVQRYSEDINRVYASLDPASRKELYALLMESRLGDFYLDAELSDPRNAHMDPKKHRTPYAVEQARARFPALRKRYMALSQAAKDAYALTYTRMDEGGAKMQRSLIDTAVENAYAAQVSNYLTEKKRAAAMGEPAPPPFKVRNRSELRQMADAIWAADDTSKLPQDVRDFLGDAGTVVVSATYQLRLAQGPYVPLRRHGDHVVSAKVEAGDGWHEFNSEAAALKFARESDLTVLDHAESGARYLDAAGREIKQGDPAYVQALVTKYTNELAPALRDDADSIRKIESKAKREALKHARDNAAKVVYRVRVQNQMVAYFDREADATRERERLIRAGYHEVAQVDLRRDPQGRKTLLPVEGERIRERVEQDPTLDPKSKADLSVALTNAMAQVSNRDEIARSFLRGRKVLGAETDIGVALSEYAVAYGNYMGAVRTARQASDGLTAMREYTEEARVKLSPGDTAPEGVGEFDTIHRREMTREFENHIEKDAYDAGGPGGTPTWLRNVLSFTFINFLWSASYSVVNATQPYATGAPYLAARYGWGDTVAAYRDTLRLIAPGSIIGGGIKDMVNAIKAMATGVNPDSTVLEQALARIEKGKNGKNVAAMVRELMRQGKIDANAGLELTRSLRPGSGPLTRGLARVEAMARAIPASVEVLNRLTVGVSAYNLAVKKGASHKDAVKAAYDAVEVTQFDYNTANTARFMDPRRYPWLAPAMTFQRYSQGIYSALATNIYAAVKGQSKTERREAMRTLGFMMMTHAAFAGALGMATEPIHLVLAALALAMGEDEPWDWTTALQNTVAEAVGPELGQVLMRGIPAGVFGLDAHTRIGLHGLAFMRDLRDYRPDTFSSYVGAMALGAPGSIAMSMLEAPRHIANGDFLRAMEAPVPKALRDVLRAARISQDGVTTQRGNRIDGGQDLSAYEAAMLAIGFTPQRVSNVYLSRNAVEGANRRFSAERSRLIQAYSRARLAGDNESVRSALADIQRWNQNMPQELRHPNNLIQRSTLQRSVNELRRQERVGEGWGALPAGRETFRREAFFNPWYDHSQVQR